MCDPVSIGLGAISIGSTIYSASEQNKQDKKNKKAAKDALKVSNRDISMRALQERIAAAQETQALNLQAAEATGLAEVSAAAGNVGGMTVDMLLQDIENTRLEGVDRIAAEQEDIQAGLMLERTGALATSRNRANQTSRANPFAVGLRIVGQGLELEANRRSRQPKITPGG